MITIDIDGHIDARQAQIDELERQLKKLAVDQFEVAVDRFHALEDLVGQAKTFMDGVDAG